MGNSIPIDLGNGYVMNIDIIGTIIIIGAFVLLALILAVLIVVVLFRQKAILKSIDEKLSLGFSISSKPLDTYPVPQSITPPPQNICPFCGAVTEPGNMFCRTCGSRL